MRIPHDIVTRLSQLSPTRDLALNLWFLTKLPPEDLPEYASALDFWHRVNDRFGMKPEKLIENFLALLSERYPDDVIFLRFRKQGALRQEPGVRLTIRQNLDRNRVDAALQRICSQLNPPILARAETHGLGGITARLETPDTRIGRGIADRLAWALNIMAELVECHSDEEGGMFATLTFNVGHGLQVTVTNIPRSERSSGVDAVLGCLCACSRHNV